MNLWLYSDIYEQFNTARNLVIFGANTLKDAVVLKNIDELESILTKLENGVDRSKVNIQKFIFSYLVDTIKISLFFENYFKAELIMNDYCVHKIINSIPEFSELKKNQSSRPIKLEEIQNILPFSIDSENKIITHKALGNNTLTFSNLVLNSKFTFYYNLNHELLNFVKKINNQRNELHFLLGVSFYIDREFIENLKKIDIFVQNVVNKYMTGYCNEKP